MVRMVQGLQTSAAGGPRLRLGHVWLATALSLGACKGEDVTLMAAEGSVDLGFGELPEDFGFATGDAAAPVADAGPPVPDAVPFDALPFSEPEAPSSPLLAEIRDFEGRFAMYARNLVTGGAVAHGAEEFLLAGPFMRILPVALFAERVATGVLDPESTLVFTEDFYRGGDKDLTPDHFGDPVKLSKLANLTLLAANPSAEELLVSALGGPSAVNDFVDGFGIEGLGRYLAPCEADRAYWRRLDARFGDVGCTALAAFARSDDARGIVPSVFDAVPVYTAEETGAAWQETMDARQNAATARGIGEVLARIHGHALPSDLGATVLRELLDHSLGSGGGGNNLPDAVWVSNLQGSVYQGRVWMGLVRGGTAPLAIVLMSDRESGSGAVGRRFDRAGMLAWEQLVGPIDLTPPAEPVATPPWLGGTFVHAPQDEDMCNARFSSDYEALLACRGASEREAFEVNESTAGTIMVNDGPDVEATWLWTEPEGDRHRYQVKLGAGGWWAWTRSFEAVKAGDWRLDFWLNGQPMRLARFPVSE